jgi:HD-GYP domain-containing protein (c-di-GMP phosphodiesterase class II)
MLEELLTQLKISAEELVSQGVLSKQAFLIVGKAYRSVNDQVEQRQRNSYEYDLLLVHSKRVALYSAELAKQYSEKINELPRKTFCEIVVAAALHDCEKLYWPRSLLSKARAELTKHDWVRITQHPDASAAFMKMVTNRELSQGTLQIISQHHENIDGTGYPERVSGEKICLGARMMRITDSYDTIVSERAYDSAKPPEVALEKLKKGAGAKYDKMLVALFEKDVSYAKKLEIASIKK